MLKIFCLKNPGQIFELDDGGRVLSFDGEGNVRERDGAGGSLLTQLLHTIINQRSVKINILPGRTDAWVCITINYTVW